MRRLKTALLALIVLLLAAQLVRPARTNPPIVADQTLEARTHVPADVEFILDRSCRDCHTNKTVWPWYTNVAPASWLVVHDVNEGRDDMNLSEWGTYDPDMQLDRLRTICRRVTKGEMPIGVYTMVHRGTALSASEVNVLCAWTRTVEASLKAKTP